MRARSGTGKGVHDRAVDALLNWKLLAVAGLELFPAYPVMQAQTNVALLSRHIGLWSLDFCRVVHVFKGESERD